MYLKSFRTTALELGMWKGLSLAGYSYKNSVRQGFDCNVSFLLGKYSSEMSRPCIRAGCSTPAAEIIVDAKSMLRVKSSLVLPCAFEGIRGSRITNGTRMDS
mmetsp:Transcript_9717/g.9817  ORF Transcript_9717/g.9817 Transcript_9717/m.9817 type:complete len:102 (-) Transcript_9717:702-1007(-)